ncbi:AMP-binding protein [Natronomonas sp. EA1]|uniref:AMP-binding protein n=1 Tax=Natronomonas sp. EA1 TaxID=3421655 RepID=UPI003EC0A5A4
MAWHIDLDYPDYETARAEFEWEIPHDYNLAYDFLRKHDPDADALYQRQPDGSTETYTFGELDELSDRVATAFAERGIGRGDRVGVVVPQKVANPLTHLACWKLGAISLPLSVLFGPDGLQYRLDDSGATAVVADESVTDAVSEAVTDCPDLDWHIEVDGDGGDTRFDALYDTTPDIDIADTTPDTDAIIIYTSGSTGPAKGVLHTHDVWLGHLPAFSMYFELDTEGVFWTPADWAWIGALGDLLWPAWHYGQPVVAYPMGKFDPREAYEILDAYDVTNAFLPPTAIRMMMNVDYEEELALEAVCSGGESLTPEIMAWADEEMDGLAINELYGQTEANIIVTNCRQWFPAQVGSMGKPAPGHDVAIIDPDTGERLPPGEVGHIAIKREGDPVVFEEYWNQPEKTASVTVDDPDGGHWHLTGDLGSHDEEGYFWFKSRDDDVIITSGYRVGPAEVESAILEHPSVEQVGVVGVPHDTRGEIIKAFVQPVSGVEGDDALREEIQQLVKDRLAKHEYPREIAFLEELPQTTTGKIRRKDLREREG